ncbi:MAG TPA: PIN domain-containing protein [Vitreimonas sp.]|uniref:type II toxin-antitoxin system VapC family toxin n=1 Tax=Vitreimonas sp. TaxID=3069702 RepID=UPI002D524374|nr:PIN domain-containing protein [Vitreimonas sp.]HYD89137.1 PIN domain-containing protein [Vitreimonas sp.]
MLLLDSAPIIYWFEDTPGFAERFEPVFALQAAGGVTLAVTTITIAEVLSGPFKRRDDERARRYRAVLESWRVVELDADLAEGAARLRGPLKLKLPDAIQVASALAINAHALVTHDRDLTRVTGLRVIS